MACEAGNGRRLEACETTMHPGTQFIVIVFSHLDDVFLPTPYLNRSLVFTMTGDAPVLYAQRPEWVDVVPIPQYEGIQPLAPIFYTPECAYTSRPVISFR